MGAPKGGGFPAGGTDQCRFYSLAVEGAEVFFTTRLGGFSSGRWRGLNVDPAGGDDPAAVTGNQRLVLEALGVPGIFFPRQVHGCGMVEVSGRPIGFEFGPEADAAFTGLPGTAVGVMTADCLPVMLHDPASGRVAAVHAGWRGIVQGIVPAAVRRLAPSGDRAAGIMGFLGPCVGPCCYEVSQEVAQEIAHAAGSREVIRETAPRPRADLKGAARRQLESAGVPSKSIVSLDLCTCCRPDLFYSYRRDGHPTGRKANIIVLKG